MKLVRRKENNNEYKRRKNDYSSASSNGSRFTIVIKICFVFLSFFVRFLNRTSVSIFIGIQFMYPESVISTIKWIFFFHVKNCSSFGQMRIAKYMY